MALIANPFAVNNGAQTGGPAGGQSNNQSRSPTGANQGNNNSGTDPTNNNGNNNLNPDPNNQNNNNNQNGNNNANSNNSGDDPMMDFSKLWDPNVGADGKEVTPTQRKYLQDLDPKALKATVDKINFTQSVTPEQRAAMLAGGEEGLNAMMDVINSVSRQTLLTGYQASHKMSGTALQQAEQGFLEQVPNHVRSANVDTALSANPIMSDPAYQPMISSLKQQFLDKYPKATPEQVQKAVTKYFDGMVAKLTPKNDTTVSNKDKLKSGAGDADWMDWVDPNSTEEASTDFLNQR